MYPPFGAALTPPGADVDMGSGPQETVAMNALSYGIYLTLRKLLRRFL